MKNYDDGNKLSIIVSIPLVWGIRNVINSGLSLLLENEFNVFYAVPPHSVESMMRLGISKEKVLKLVIPKTTHSVRIASSSLQNAYGRKKSTKSDLIFEEWNKRKQGDSGKWRKISLSLMRPIVSNRFGFKRVENFVQKQYSLTMSQDLRKKISEIHPSAALSTSYVSNWEWPLFNYLQNLHIPTATHILSFDNLTSRGYFPLGRFNQYYSWQQTMSDELTHFFEIDSKKIRITGTPQFDFHILPSYNWDRQFTGLRLGINPERPYIAYCANHYQHTPGELQLILFLIKALRETEQFNNYQWVIRIHPMDKFDRWKSFFENDSNVIISHPWKREDELSYWGTPDNDEIALLSNTLRHSVATVTMASTIALDCCVTDTPIICVGFHPQKDSLENKYYHDVHFTHHFEPIILSGAVNFVQSAKEFIDAMISAVENPAKNHSQRVELQNLICGKVDGKSSDRIAEEFIKLVYK